MPRIPASILIPFLLASHSAAQVVTFPLQAPKNPEASSKAGIGAYSVSREGDLVRVEVFGLDQERLATCEPVWHDGWRSQVCQLAGGGKFEAVWREESMEFADLEGGDHIAVRLEESPAFEEFGEVDPSISLGEFVLSGTKSYEEVERDWAQVLHLFSFTLNEVETTLGISPEQLAETTSSSESLIRCAPDDVPFCNTMRSVPGNGNGVGIPAACTNASQNADVECRMATGESCCANSQCSGICFFGNLCRMTLRGFLWDCERCV